MSKRKRTTIPYQVRQIATKHKVSIQQALIVYAEIQRARAVSTDTSLQSFAKGLASSINNFKLNRV